MQDGFVLERIAADHIHVNVGAQTSPDIGMAAEVGHGAFYLRPPNKAQGAFRTRQRSAADQPRQYAGRFQNGYAAAAIIVCTRPLMVQMAAVNYFTAGWVRARDDPRYDGPVARTHFGFHTRVEDDLLPRLQTCPQRLGGVPRNHECESGWLAGFQMTPAHHGAIQA